jgi:hypothetical protein
VEFFRRPITALTTLSQRWNTLSWLAGVVEIKALVVAPVLVEVRAGF